MRKTRDNRLTNVSETAYRAETTATTGPQRLERASSKGIVIFGKWGAV